MELVHRTFAYPITPLSTRKLGVRERRTDRALASALKCCILLGCLALAKGPDATAASSAQVRSWLAQKACALQGDSRPERAHHSRCPDLPALVTRARKAVPSGLTPSATLERINSFFFQAEDFQAAYELDRPENLLVNGVLASKRGHCVGLATVYLILAEEMRLPIYAVATPKHVFLRWDDGHVRRNIELFQEGREVPDEDYARDQKIPKESIRRGVFLANLSRREFLGFIYQNRGVLESQAGDFAGSGRDYRMALRLNPKLAAAYYNRGNDELKQKRYRQAIREYTKSLRLYPTDPWALKNLELARKGLRQAENTRGD
jgi:regulator of sirC expression with transglutaminase-like and TPR domain